MNVAAAFVRVSTGSQDETSQVRVIEAFAEERGITLVKVFRLRGYSASRGAQEPALLEAVADMRRGDYEALIVTDSSRLDRREDLDAQAEILLAIRLAGGDVISVTEPTFGQTDFPGRVVTLVTQYGNAEKSRAVKSSTYRGIAMIRDNGAHHGHLPAFWRCRGKRYAKQAYCFNPEGVSDIYERVAGGESLSSVGRAYDMYPNSIRNLIAFAANYTGVAECSYTYEGVTETWTHEVAPVIDSALWWRANKVLEENRTGSRVNRGGRPVAQASNWLSGILPCPACGGKLYIHGGPTPAGNARTPKMRCGGAGKKRVACGGFKAVDARPVVELVDEMFASDSTDVLAFQRVSGNAHLRDALNADLRRIQARLSATEDDDELDALVAERRTLKAKIAEFTVVPDSYDYAPTGRTVAQMWAGGDDAVKRNVVRAVRDSCGLVLSKGGDGPRVAVGATDTGTGAGGFGEAGGIVDLGDGLCFRVQSPKAA